MTSAEYTAYIANLFDSSHKTIRPIEEIRELCRDVVLASRLSVNNDTETTATSAKYSPDHQGTLFSYQTAVRTSKRIKGKFRRDAYTTAEEREEATQFLLVLEALINSYDRTYGKAVTEWYVIINGEYKGPFKSRESADRQLSRITEQKDS